MTEPLARAIEQRSSSTRPVDRDPCRSAQLQGRESGGRPGRLARIVRLARKVPEHLRQHGVKATASVIRQIARSATPAPCVRSRRTRPRIVVLGHRLDLSGAPFVLVDSWRDGGTGGLGPHLRLFTYEPVHASNLERLAGSASADHPPAPRRRGPSARDRRRRPAQHVRILPGRQACGLRRRSKEGVVKQLFWYVHEDAPERIFSDAETARIRRLSRAGKLTIVTLSQQACRRYSRHFGADILLEPHRVDLPGEVPHRPRQPTISRRSASSCPARSSTDARDNTPCSTPWRRSTGNTSAGTGGPIESSP